MNCPNCNSEMDRHEVDVGVGTIYGPWSCPNCPYAEIDHYALDDDYPSEREDEGNRVVSDYYESEPALMTHGAK